VPRGVVGTVGTQPTRRYPSSPVEPLSQSLARPYYVLLASGIPKLARDLKQSSSSKVQLPPPRGLLSLVAGSLLRLA
jgi:hypothetical protein